MLRCLTLVIAVFAATHLAALAVDDWSEGDTLHVIAGKVTSPVALYITGEGELVPDPWPWFEIHILRYNAEGELLDHTSTWYRDVYVDGKKSGQKLRYGWSAPTFRVSTITAKGQALVYLWDYPCLAKFKNGRLQSATGVATDDEVIDGDASYLYTYKSDYRANASLAKAIMKAMAGEGATWPATAQDVVDAMLEKKGYLL